MTEREGWALPENYGDGDTGPEYNTVRNGGAGVIDLSARGRILVSGSEAVTFLNGLITNDVKTLAKDSWMCHKAPAKCSTDPGWRADWRLGIWTTTGGWTPW